MFRKVERIIGRVPDSIPDFVVYFHGPFDGIFAPTDRLHGIIDNRLVVAIDNGSWGKVFIIHSIYPFS